MPRIIPGVEELPVRYLFKEGWACLNWAFVSINEERL